MVKPSMFGYVTEPTARESAEAAFRAFCGWHVAPVVRETLTRSGNGRSLLKLPTARIVDVHEVLVDGRDVTSQVRWDEAGMLQGVKFPHRFRSVQVELEHGYEPAEVADVLGIIKGAADRVRTDPRVRSQSVAGASVQYLTTRNGGPLTHLLTEDEKAALAPYMLYWGV